MAGKRYNGKPPCLRSRSGRQARRTLWFNGSTSPPPTLQLSQNFPHPFNPETVISYTVHTPGVVSLRLYNLLGEEIRSLVDRREDIGHKRVKWDGRDNRGHP